MVIHTRTQHYSDGSILVRYSCYYFSDGGMALHGLWENYMPDGKLAARVFMRHSTLIGLAMQEL